MENKEERKNFFTMEDHLQEIGKEESPSFDFEKFAFKSEKSISSQEENKPTVLFPDSNEEEKIEPNFSFSSPAEKTVQEEKTTLEEKKDSLKEEEISFKKELPQENILDSRKTILEKQNSKTPEKAEEPPKKPFSLPSSNLSFLEEEKKEEKVNISTSQEGSEGLSEEKTIKRKPTFNVYQFLKALGVIFGILGVFVGGYFLVRAFLFKNKNPLAFLPQNNTFGFLYFDVSPKNNQFQNFNQLVKEKGGKGFLEGIFSFLQKGFLGEDEILKWQEDISPWLGDHLLVASIKKKDDYFPPVILLEVKDKKKAQESFQKIEDNLKNRNFEAGEEVFEGVKIRKITVKDNLKNTPPEVESETLSAPLLEKLYFVSFGNFLGLSSDIEALKDVILCYKNPKNNPSLLKDQKFKKTFEDLSSKYAFLAYWNYEKASSSFIESLGAQNYRESFLGAWVDGKNLLVNIENPLKENRALETFTPQLLSFVPASSLFSFEVKNLKQQNTEGAVLKEAFNIIDKNTQEISNRFISLLENNAVEFLVLDPQEISRYFNLLYPWEFKKSYLGFIADVKGKERKEVVDTLVAVENLIKDSYNQGIKEKIAQELENCPEQTQSPKDLEDLLDPTLIRCESLRAELEKPRQEAKIIPITFEGKTFYSVVLPYSQNRFVSSFNFAYFDDKVFYTTSQEGMKELILVSLGKAPSLKESPYFDSFEGLKFPAAMYFNINPEKVFDIIGSIAPGLLNQVNEDQFFDFVKGFQYIKGVHWSEEGKDIIQVKFFSQ